MMNPTNLALLAATALTLAAGCGRDGAANKDVLEVGKDSHIALPASATGCIQGVVLNGLTGERIDLPAASAVDGKGLLVRVRDKLLAGTNLAAAFAQNAAMKGEYSLCGVPVEDEFPLYALVDGYQAFGAKIKVPSTVAQLTPQADADLQKPTPTRIYNIRLYPVGQQTQDLTVHVLYAARPVKGATVQLTPANQNFLDGGDFLAPSNGALLTLSAVTDDAGNATFTADKLALGGSYDYTVLPAAGALDTATRVAGAVTIGLLAGKAAHDPYTVDVNLDNTAPKLAVISESREPNAEGRKVCILNRPVALVLGTADGITATLSGAATAKLRDATAGNDSSETVNVEISKDGYTVTLTPVWEKSADLSKEPAIAVDYAGIFVKPAATPELAERLDLGAACKLHVGLAL